MVRANVSTYEWIQILPRRGTGMITCLSSCHRVIHAANFPEDQAQIEGVRDEERPGAEGSRKVFWNIGGEQSCLKVLYLFWHKGELLSWALYHLIPVILQ